MEGPIFQPSMPFRPIPVYGQRLQTGSPRQRLQTGTPRIPSPDDTPFPVKHRADNLALTKHLNLITQMSHLRSLGEYQLGHLGQAGNIVSSQVLQGINKFSVNNLGIGVENERTHAIAQQKMQTFESRKMIEFSGPNNTQTDVNSRLQAENSEAKDRHMLDRMTVPVIVSCVNPFTSQYGYGRKVFPCPQCRYTTDRRNNLKRHMLTMHQTCSKTLECCGIVFATKASLREHSMIFHYHGYTCFYCGRRFCRKALLKRHLSVHNGQKDFVCPVCDYATSHKSNLERHRKVHCRPEDSKSDEMHCGTEDEQYLQKTLTWRSEGGHDADDNNNRDISGDSESSDDEDEEINVDSD